MRQCKIHNAIDAGARVRVAKRLLSLERPDISTINVEGVVVSCRPDKTGSWYAHGKDDRYWLMRLSIKKDDGELTDIVLDENCQVEIVEESEQDASPRQ
jgi:hypothetical protein